MPDSFGIEPTDNCGDTMAAARARDVWHMVLSSSCSCQNHVLYMDQKSTRMHLSSCGSFCQFFPRYQQKEHCRTLVDFEAFIKLLLYEYAQLMGHCSACHDLIPAPFCLYTTAVGFQPALRCCFTICMRLVLLFLVFF